MELFSDIPSDLASGPVRLIFDGIVTPDSHPELVPYYHFEISTEDQNTIGHINLRIGRTRHIELCVGHVGYEVDSRHRGQAFAYHACIALSPFILRHYDNVVLTSDPNNRGSIRTIERLGARFVDEIIVPRDDPSYASGARTKRRYEWEPPDSRRA